LRLADLVGRNGDKAPRRDPMKVVPWVFGVGALAFLPVLVALMGPESAEDWIAAYFAGAVGGLALELTGGAWGLELPSYEKGRKPKNQRWAPFGPWVDIGFLGRMTTGAVAAPAFLIIINSVLEDESANDLATIATNPDTLAWAVLIGAASPAVWRTGQRLVEARLGALQQQLESGEQLVTKAKEEVAKVQGTPNDQKAMGVVLGRLETTAEVLRSGSKSDV
jgi:hypothetical protein